ncbi:T9SS type A sorting domain-containing protein, partial [Flavobacterium terrisoli]|uniref:T9SS type A sorting domain-containing protein n=1 Tax=Flavobacterium terrisoli TaxID=3242195 RepID=UPI002542F046
SGGCNPQGSYGEVSAPNACGGTITVTYTVTDKCYQTSTVSRTFTITAPPALVLGSPDSTIVNSCDYADQAALEVAFATWLSQFTVSGGCAPVGDYGSPLAPPLCTGGTTTVTYAVTDKCTSPSVTETFTVVPATKLEIICPADRTVECGEDAATIFEAWRDTFGHTGGCANAVSTDLSQIQMPEPGQPLVVTFTVTDNCQTVSCTARFFINECAYCTYTQGYYGNIKGSACTPEGSLTNAKAIMINAITLAGGEYDFGSTATGNYFKLTLADITSNNIFKMMPGGGTPRALIGFATYSVPSTYSDNDPLKGSGPQKGRINNVLLSQTMALFFNTQLNSELGDFELEPNFVTADTGVCGSDTPVPGTEAMFNIPQPVINYLNANGGATVGNLLVLANRALGGQSIGNVTPAQVNQAVDAINRGFDECRVYVGTVMPEVPFTGDLVSYITSKTESDDMSGSMSVKVYPNPYTDNFNLSLTTSNDSKVTVAVYDMVGRVIETRELSPRESSEVKIGDKYPSGVYNIVVTQGEDVRTLKVVKR